MNEITEEKNLDCRRENYLEEFKRENNPDLLEKYKSREVGSNDRINQNA
ncbi:hypothetical protein [Melissococcus plutonius]|nr:hypothetical protein [Melissococcus plutonius]MCV2499666.1 hypothetical protein [Melissococcus plutonius]MCV2501954.1 hypothetical protein [Melissococcus plutonius]MCV2508279.1 hypothetical protein [Melissococcus plutonius]MCV2528195.1 hypothetical protein [Melissococcus plutonius]